MGRHVSLHTSRAAPFPLGLRGPWGPVLRDAWHGVLQRAFAGARAEGETERCSTPGLCPCRVKPLAATCPQASFSPSALTGPGCKRRDEPKRSTSGPSSSPGLTLSYAPFGCGRGAKPRGRDVLLTLKISARRRENVGLGIPNPIHDWVYGDKPGARTASALGETTPPDTTDGTMSSPTFSDPLVAARGRDVSHPPHAQRTAPVSAPRPQASNRRKAI